MGIRFKKRDRRLENTSNSRARKTQGKKMLVGISVEKDRGQDLRRKKGQNVNPGTAGGQGSGAKETKLKERSSKETGRRKSDSTKFILYELFGKWLRKDGGMQQKREVIETLGRRQGEGKGEAGLAYRSD